MKPQQLVQTSPASLQCPHSPAEGFVGVVKLHNSIGMLFSFINGVYLIDLNQGCQKAWEPSPQDILIWSSKDWGSLLGCIFRCSLYLNLYMSTFLQRTHIFWYTCNIGFTSYNVIMKQFEVKQMDTSYILYVSQIATIIIPLNLPNSNLNAVVLLNHET